MNNDSETEGPESDTDSDESAVLISHPTVDNGRHDGSFSINNFAKKVETQEEAHSFLANRRRETMNDEHKRLDTSNEQRVPPLSQSQNTQSYDTLVDLDNFLDFPSYETLSSQNKFVAVPLQVMTQNNQKQQGNCDGVGPKHVLPMRTFEQVARKVPQSVTQSSLMQAFDIHDMRFLLNRVGVQFANSHNKSMLSGKLLTAIAKGKLSDVFTTRLSPPTLSTDDAHFASITAGANKGLHRSASLPIPRSAGGASQNFPTHSVSNASLQNQQMSGVTNIGGHSLARSLSLMTSAADKLLRNNTESRNVASNPVHQMAHRFSGIQVTPHTQQPDAAQETAGAMTATPFFSADFMDESAWKPLQQTDLLGLLEDEPHSTAGQHVNITGGGRYSTPKKSSVSDMLSTQTRSSDWTVCKPDLQELLNSGDPDHLTRCLMEKMRSSGAFGPMMKLFNKEASGDTEGDVDEEQQESRKRPRGISESAVSAQGVGDKELDVDGVLSSLRDCVLPRWREVHILAQQHQQQRPQRCDEIRWGDAQQLNGFRGSYSGNSKSAYHFSGLKVVRFTGHSLGLVLGKMRADDGTEHTIIQSKAARTIDPHISRLLTVGDRLHSINGCTVAGLAFAEQISAIKSSTRPLELAFST